MPLTRTICSVDPMVDDAVDEGMADADFGSEETTGFDDDA